jgi:hypothetical protein
MSFLKSIVKEINVAKSMIDIPGLKEERDKLQSELEKCLAEIEKVNTVVVESVHVCETATNFQKYCKYLNSEDQQIALQLSEKLQQYVGNSQLKLTEHMDKRDALNSKIELVNDKLKKARTNVK